MCRGHTKPIPKLGEIMVVSGRRDILRQNRYEIRKPYLRLEHSTNCKNHIETLAVTMYAYKIFSRR